MIWRFKILLIGALLAVHGFAAVLALNPRVDNRYRWYYIEQSLMCSPGDARLRYALGSIVHLRSTAVCVSRYGWSGAERTGRWTEGRNASLFLSPVAWSASDVEFRLRGFAFVMKRHPELRVDVAINDRPVGQWIFREPQEPGDYRLTIPRQILASGVSEAGERLVKIEFRIHNPESPARFKLSPDRRRLGLHVVSVCLAADTGDCGKPGIGRAD